MSAQPAPTAGSTATQEQVEWFRQTFDRLVENIDRAVLGKDHVTRLALTCLLSRGSPAPRGLPRDRQDPAGPGPRGVGAGVEQPDPVHPRPAAERRHGRDDLRPEHQEVRVPPRADLRDHRPRRRDQPRVAEDPVGAPRGHGGGARHRRRRTPQRRRHVHGHRDPEPDRAGGHLPAARGAAGPVPHEDQRRLPRLRGDDPDPQRRQGPRPRPPAPAGGDRRRRRRHGGARRRGLRRPRPAGLRHLDRRGLAPAPVPQAGAVGPRLPRLRALRQDLGRLAGPQLRDPRRHQDARRPGPLAPAAARRRGPVLRDDGHPGHRADPRRRPAAGPGQRPGAGVGRYARGR